MAFGSGFARGWTAQGNDLLSQQGEQLKQALAIADQVMQERQAEHATKFQEFNQAWMRDPNNPNNIEAATKKQQADTTEKWRKESEERQSKEDAEQAIQKTLSEARLHHSAGEDWGASYAPLKRLDPKLWQEELDHKLNSLKHEWKTGAGSATPAPQEIPMLQGAQAPFIPQAGGGQPAPPPQMPPEAMAALGAMPGPAGMAPMMPQSPQIPQAPPPQGSVMGQAALGPGVMPGQQMPPGMITPPGAPEPTMDDAMRSMSPQFLMNQEKMRAEEHQKAVRAQASMIAAQAKEGMLPIQQEIANVRASLAQTAAARDARDQAAMEQRLGKYAPSLDTIEKAIGVRKDLADNLDRHQRAMEGIADRRAKTYAASVAKNSAAANQSYGLSQRLAMGAEKEYQTLQKSAAAIDKNLSEMIAGYDVTVLDTSEAGSSKAFQQALMIGKLRKQRQEVIADAAKAKTVALELRHIADQQLHDMNEKGLNTYSDGKRIPPSRRPSAPKSLFDKAATELGIP